MPRSEVSLTPNVWIQIGVAGQLTVTVQDTGPTSFLLINSAQVDAASIIKGQGSSGNQIVQTSDTESTYCKATGPGWVVTLDQE